MIGSRLKEERTRLGYTQPVFAEIAGAKKRTLIDWEKDVSSPTAVQLSALAEHGLDVMYVLTGTRSAPVPDPLSVRERHLLDNYRGSSEEGRRAVESTASALAHRDSAKQTGSGK